jgi:CHAT domain-containing protein
MHYRMTIHILLIILLITCFAHNTFAAGTDDLLRKANDYLNQGQYYLAQQEAESVLKSKISQAQRAIAHGIKGNTLLIMQRYSEAEESLLKAYELTEEKQRKAGYANSLGMLYLKMQDKLKSQQYFRLAAEFVENNTILALRIKLNQMRVQPEEVGLPKLKAILSEIAAADSAVERVRYYLNLASIAQAYALSSYTEVIQHALESAHADSTTIADKTLRIEALNSLAEFYESQGKSLHALQLSEQASTLPDRVSVDDLMIQIEWRKGRIYQQQGRDSEALVAFGKAVDHIQAIRRDIPVSYEDGKSSFRKTLEPVYLGYTHQLLKKASQQDEEAKQQTLVLARQTIELIKQSELEDFLGGRCLIEGMQRSVLNDMDAQAAILYPIILEDRLELLLGIGKTIRQFSVSVPEKQFNETISLLSRQLRSWILTSGQANHSDAHQKSTENLYRWMIAPIENDLESSFIKTLVIVPDGMLRLVPFAALFDGRKYLIEKYAISISPGMTLMGNKKDPQLHTYQTFLAGVSKPGPVVEKLSRTLVDDPLLLAESSYSDQITEVRGMSNQRYRNIKVNNAANNATDSTRGHDDAKLQKLREMLSLPGVEAELNSLNETLKSTLLLNEQFTVANFYQQMTQQSFDIVHIASHGFFSSDADKSFLMAYDDIVKLDDLKNFLKKGKNDAKGIQLLTFSACETAEGDDRAPMGFTGAALQTNAQSALGSLWPISDEAASQLMISFYNNLMQHLSKAEALRQAQLELLKTDHMRHPSFWSPFILVGNWL